MSELIKPFFGHVVVQPTSYWEYDWPDSGGNPPPWSDWPDKEG